MSDALVVYFSRKGYVRREAEALARGMGADLLELRTPERTRGVLGFWWCGRFGMHRWPMKLLPYDTDVSRYERVVIVSPVWVFSACAPVYAFAREQRGRVKSARYVFVHFSPFMRYPKTARALDRLLDARSEGYASAACAWGHVYLRREYAALSRS